MINQSTATNTDTGLKRQLPYSSLTISYRSEGGLWRGFVMPYDLTYEASTKEEVVKVLKEMIGSYEEALRDYDHPAHLCDVPFSQEEDRRKFASIGLQLIEKLVANHARPVEGPDYYAEAKLPA